MVAGASRRAEPKESADYQPRAARRFSGRPRRPIHELNSPARPPTERRPRMQTFDPSPVAYRTRLIRRRTRLLFMIYSLLGLTLAVFL